MKVGAGVSFSILLTASGKRELIKFTEELEVLIVLSTPLPLSISQLPLFFLTDQTAEL